MKVFGWIIIFLLGISIINTLAYRIKTLEKIGFALPIGMGINSLLMFIMDLLHIPINEIYLLLSIDLIIIVGLSIFTYRKNKSVFSFEPILKTFHPKNLFSINLAWVFLMSCAIYVIYAIVSKTLFWPVFIYDSISGYDFLAKAIVEEGTLNNSIFSQEYPLFTVRSLYPPLVPLNFGFAYLLGFSSSKIVVAFFYISIFIVFYSLLTKYSTHLAAVFFSLLLAITPEFAFFSSLSSPNPPTTFYSALGILCLYTWIKGNDRSYFNMGVILIVLAIWTRTEAVIFAAGGGLLVFIKSIEEKQFKPFIIFCFACLSVFLLWQWYTKFILHIQSAQTIITHLYWDPGKLLHMLQKVKVVTFRLRYYGIVVYLFLSMILINIVFIIKQKDRIDLLAAIWIAWFLYLFIYYQIDTTYLPNTTSWIEAGYRRGFFYFLPLMLFYCATNKISNTIFKKYLII